MDSATSRDEDKIPAEAHVHIDALQRLLGVRIQRGTLLLSFHEDVARSAKVELHRHIAGAKGT